MLMNLKVSKNSNRLRSRTFNNTRGQGFRLHALREAYDFCPSKSSGGFFFFEFTVIFARKVCRGNYVTRGARGLIV